MKRKIIAYCILVILLFGCGVVNAANDFNSNTNNYTDSYKVVGDELIVGKNEKYTSIMSAIKAASNGDVILVKGGKYNEEIILSKGNITIRNYPGETPILDGAGLETIFDFNGQDNVTLEGFKVQNITNKQWAAGVYLGGGEKHIILRNLEVTGIINPKPTNSNYGANPIILYGEKNESISDVIIENCYVHDNVTGWCEAIAVSGNCENIQVLNNRVDNNGNIGIDFCGNFGYCPTSSLDQPRNCVARGNVISNCNSPYATSYGLYADGAKDIIFENNVIYNSQGGIEIGAEEKTNNTVGNIQVINNLVYNCSENGITVGGYETGLGNVDNVLISHNTVVNNNCELTLSKCSNVTIQYNIFVANKNLMYSEMSSSYTKNISFNNNVYNGSGYMLANKTYNDISWKKSIDVNAITESIKLNSDYTLVNNIKGNDGKTLGFLNKSCVEEEKPSVEEEKPSVEEEKPSVEEEKPSVEEEKPSVEEEKPSVEGNKKVLDSFTKNMWYKETGVTDIKITNKNSIEFKSMKSWKGLFLEDTSFLKKGDRVAISVKSISKNSEIEIWVDGKQIAKLDSKNTSQTITIPSNKNIDICIVSTKNNTTVKVTGLKIVKK